MYLGPYSDRRQLLCSTVRRNILASQKVEMHPKSKVVGDVTTPAINIEIGAILDGKCNMSKKQNIASEK